MKDHINPNHYQRDGLECIDAIRAAVQNLTGFEAYCTGNIIKYAWRWDEKGGKEDLDKIRRYAQFLIEDIEEEEMQQEMAKDVSFLETVRNS